jgi:hypothetical protein
MQLFRKVRDLKISNTKHKKKRIQEKHTSLGKDWDEWHIGFINCTSPNLGNKQNHYVPLLPHPLLPHPLLPPETPHKRPRVEIDVENDGNETCSTVMVDDNDYRGSPIPD